MTIDLDRWVVVVTGSREWTDEEAMRACLSVYKKGTLLIHGGAIGADQMAGRLAVELGFRVLEEPYFGEAGKLGGPKRNQLLVDIARAYQWNGYNVVVEAFPLAGCSGTHDCVRRAELNGLFVRSNPVRDCRSSK